MCKEKGAVGFVATDGNESPAWRGVWDWDGADVDLWRVVGVGYFAGSTVDHDGILLYNGIGMLIYDERRRVGIHHIRRLFRRRNR